MVVIEAMSKMMSATVDRGLLSGFLVGLRNNEDFVVSLLLFADGTLIFCEANSEQLCNLCCLFLCFEPVLGLKLNVSKSEIIPIGQVADVVWLIYLGVG